MNLLPKIERENLAKGLKLRFVIMFLFLLSASFWVGFISLLPSYFLTSGYFSSNAESAFLLKYKDDESVKSILNLPQEINSKLNFLQLILKEQTPASYFSKISNLLPKGVKINSISFAKDQNFKGKVGTIILISGIAGSRDSLISFTEALEESNLFSLVEVPVSSLTKNRDLPFSIDIFIENQK